MVRLKLPCFQLNAISHPKIGGRATLYWHGGKICFWNLSSLHACFTRRELHTSVTYSILGHPATCISGRASQAAKEMQQHVFTDGGAVIGATTQRARMSSGKRGSVPMLLATTNDTLIPAV